MDKKIIAIMAAVAVVFVVVAGIFIMKKKNTTQKSVQPSVQSAKTNSQPAVGEKTKDQACLDSGGTVESGTCCQSAGDFPNLCLIGACGCVPTSSHQVKTCNCGERKCFDGSACAGK